jgi:hypothetical protein
LSGLADLAGLAVKNDAGVECVKIEQTQDTAAEKSNLQMWKY